METSQYQKYSGLLHDELLMALGCTEPVCIAYCAAVMRQALGDMPDQIVVECSGNIVKNVKGAVVPNSEGMKGIDAAATLGVVGGDPGLALEVLTAITTEDIEKTRYLLGRSFCRVKLMETADNLHVIVTGYLAGHKATAELVHTHTGLVRVTRDGEVLFAADAERQDDGEDNDLTELLNVARILEFAETVDLDAYGLRALIEKQIDCNSRIAREGLEHPYGACVGATLLRHYGNGVATRAKAYAAAGSDARMSGCEMPVVINSGSGNRGLAVSLPVIEYARDMEKTHDELIRALLISNLVALRIKSSYGRLSAFCGAVTAATGSGAAITWLHGGTYDQIATTIINTLANISGMVCDGAKASCACKIASAVDTALMAHCLSMEDRRFQSGDGLVKQDLEKTIQSISRMASEGMVETDRTILQLMMEEM